ncbi:hypothetical protein VTJ04DRAFT_5291 [Mycothermus thermophilus]|uniref:uncharacterized protein n=1 Tax=Humicola insolens TaxID=85995 RepID=UPI003742E11A
MSSHDDDHHPPHLLHARRPSPSSSHHFHHRRQQQAQRLPCPRGNGTTIGSVQDFTVLCNTSLEGQVLAVMDAFDFRTCADLCSSFHPKCEGITYLGSSCTLQSRLRPSDRRFSLRGDSAIANFPTASSNCASLGGTQTVGQQVGQAVTFTTMCGTIIAGNDLGQNFAPTFQDCLGQCAFTEGCRAVTFDPGLELGFRNCYLKSGAGDGLADAAPDGRVDSAVLAGDGGAAPPAEGGGGQQGGGGVGVSTIPLPNVPTPTGGGAGVIFTPPAPETSPLASTTSTEQAAPDATPTPTTTTSSSSSLLLPDTTAISSSDPSPSIGSDIDDGSAAASPSMAWIAAPVVGGVAALALIAVSFMMLRRRRRGGQRRRRPGSSDSNRSSESGEGWMGMLMSWLPWGRSEVDNSGRMMEEKSIYDRERAAGGGSSSRRMTGIGNFSAVESSGSKRSSVDGGGSGGGRRNSVRNSVVGLVTGRPAGMERLEDVPEGEAEGGKKDGRKSAKVAAALRDSLNGLAQNKWEGNP